MKKKVFFLMVLLSAACFQMNAETVGDTLVIDKPGKVKIETREDLQRIVITGAKDDDKFHYVQRISYEDSSAVKRTITSVKDFTKRKVDKNKKKKVEVSPYWLIGLNTMVGASSDYSFRLWPAFEWSVGFTVDWHPFGHRNVWRTGFIIDWRNYRLQDDKCWVKNPSDNQMVMVDYDPAYSDRKTTMTAFSLQLPLLYTHNFDDRGRWSVTLGALINFNTGAHTTRQYTYNDEDYEVKTTGIGQRPVTVDGYLELGIPSFPDLYVKYCPNTFFKDGRGPKMHQLSFGLSF